MFRNPNEVTSSDPESSEEEENASKDIQEQDLYYTTSAADTTVGSPLEAFQSTTTTESIQGNLDRPIPPDWTHDLTPDGHATLLLASLLQGECRFQAAQMLNARYSTTRFTRDSPEAQQLGDQMYRSSSQQLASAGVLAKGLEHGDWDDTRTLYRDLISHQLQTSLDGPSQVQMRPQADSSFVNLAPSRPTSSSSQVMQRALTGSAPIPTEHQTVQTQGDFQNLSAFVNLDLQSTHLGCPQPADRNATIQRLQLLQRQENLSQLPRQPPLLFSRYQSDFREGGVLGKGGYGTVYQVTNIVDGQDYAIKKIPLSAKRLTKLQDGGKQELEKILKEIRTLARLEHSNIVRYYAAWIQQMEFPSAARHSPMRPPVQRQGSSRLLLDSPSRKGTELEHSSQGSSSELSEDGGHEIVFGEDTDPIHGTLSLSRRSVNGLSDDGIVFEESESAGEDSHGASPNDDESEQRKPRTKPTRRRASQATVASTISRKSYVRSTGPDDEEVETIPRAATQSHGQTTTIGVTNDEDIFTDGLGEARTNARVNSSIDSHSVTLHIQMSLHPLSLSSYLMAPREATSVEAGTFKNMPTRRHCYHVVPSLRLFLAILSGVEYLHTQGVVHRDLKPGNIFLSEHQGLVPPAGCVDVGACPECEPEHVPLTRHVSPRIGDFGLVTDIAKTGGFPDLSVSPTKHDKPIGTEFYRPPLPLSGYASADEKLDVFALGVIFFELLWKLDTKMERHMVLGNLTKRSVLPAEFSKKVRFGRGEEIGIGLQECIKGMVHPTAAERLNCAQVRGRVEALLGGLEA